MERPDGGEPDPSDTIDVLKCLRCKHEGCTNVPSYGYRGEDPILCSEHATPVMMEVVALRCREPHCTSRRTFGFDGATAEYCAEHTQEGMVDLMKRRTQCVLPNCTKLSTYGVDGFLARFCFAHKSQGMVYLKNRKRCEYYECTRQPTYGMDGQPAKFCSSHKEEGMVDVKNCRCKHPGCTRQPNYGHEGGRAKYCSSHKLDKMVNVVSRKCEFAGCKRQPTYGREGEKAIYCPQHRLEPMVDVVNRHCEFAGCTKTPSYGYAGERAIYCSNHHLPDMEDVKNRRCEWNECRRYPTFGNEGERARFCSAHRTDGMVNVRNRKCEVANCSKVPTYGVSDGKAQFCLTHVRPGMVNIRGAKGSLDGMLPRQEKGEFGPHVLAGGAGMGASPGSDATRIPGRIAGGGGPADSQSSVRGSLGTGMEGPGDGGSSSSMTFGEQVYGGQRRGQSPASVVSWGVPRSVWHEDSVGSAGSHAMQPTGVLSGKPSERGPASKPEAGVSSHRRRLGAQALTKEDQRQKRPEAREPQDLTQQHLRSQGVQFRYSSRLEQQEQHRQQLSRPHSSASSGLNLLPPMTSSRNYGPGGNEVGDVLEPSILAGQASTLRPPQSLMPVARPRPLRPRHPSPGRALNVPGTSEGILAEGRAGDNVSPFLAHQPSPNLRLPLPQVPVAVSGSFPSEIRSSNWGGDSRGKMDVSGGDGGDDGGTGVGEGESGERNGAGAGWMKDMEITMHSVGFSQHDVDALGAASGMGGGGACGENARGQAGACSSSMIGGSGSGSAAGLGARLSPIDFPPGLIQTCDRVPTMGDVRASSPAAFSGIGAAVGDGGVVGERASLISPPPGHLGTSAAVGIPSRTLSPLMHPLGDPAESPPGIPRLGSPSRRLDGHGAAPSLPAFLDHSSAAGVTPADLEGFQREIQSAGAPTEYQRALPSLQILGQESQGMASALEGGLSVRDPLHQGGRSSTGAGAHDEWMPLGAGTIGKDRALGAGIGGGEPGAEGDFDDSRRNFRVEDLLH